GSTTIHLITPEELAAILARGGGILTAGGGDDGEDEEEDEDGESFGSGGSGSGGSSGSEPSPCISLGAGFLFTPTGRYQRKFHVVTGPCETQLNAQSARDAIGLPILGDSFP